MTLPPIYFYLPAKYFPEKIPDNANENWTEFGLGMYSWTIQSYLRLKEANFPCQLVSSLPAEGIVLAHYGALLGRETPWQIGKPYFNTPVIPSSKLLLVCLKGDGRQYPYAQIQVVQNPLEAELGNNCYYIPHWPQPGLIQRRLERGNQFENIAYFGRKKNLTAELRASSWKAQIEQLGLCWRPVINSNTWTEYDKINTTWNDYGDIDAVVAVRSFGGSEHFPQHPYRNKPATKLFNAWLAGVPAILGYESAYRAEGKPQCNYLEVFSLSQLLSTLKCLKQDPSFRERIKLRGSQEAHRIAPQQITQYWIKFLMEIAVPAFYRWSKRPRWQQKLTFLRGQIEFNTSVLNSKLFVSDFVEYR